MNTIPCISLWQPWASLLVSGAKAVETRSWPTAHRGRILIHAAKTWSHDLDDLCFTPPFRAALEALGFLSGSSKVWNADLPFGAVVGSVDVVDCVPTDDSRETPDVTGWAFREGNWTREKAWVSPTERAFGDYGPGRFAWLCKNPVRFAAPVPFRGRQQIFRVPADLIPEECR